MSLGLEKEAREWLAGQQESVLGPGVLFQIRERDLLALSSLLRRIAHQAWEEGCAAGWTEECVGDPTLRAVNPYPSPEKSR